MTIKQFFRGLSYMFSQFSPKTKFIWTLLVLLFGIYVIQKISVPSFDSYREKAKITTGKIENQKTTAGDGLYLKKEEFLKAPAPIYDPIQKWGEQKVASAKKVMALANQDCRIYEEDPHLVVEMRMYITDPNQRLGYVRAIADSDVILHGQPRNIYFYDPSNKKIAQADTLNGVRLID